MATLKGVVFDLDDTLYYEVDYVRSGFEAVALAISPQPLGQQLFEFMWSAFNSGIRGRIFDQLLEHYPHLNRTYSVADLVLLYRQHIPEISLLPEMEDLLIEMKARGIKLGVISDGPHDSQLAKAQALRINQYASVVILTDAWGHSFWKPHVRAFNEMARLLDLLPTELVYIGDNPAKDFYGPQQLGWHSVRLRLPMQLRCHQNCEPGYAPTCEVTSVKELRDLLLTQIGVGVVAWNHPVPRAG
jgi:putative hydrolase of the HAD superfamily